MKFMEISIVPFSTIENTKKNVFYNFDIMRNNFGEKRFFGSLSINKYLPF